MNIVKWVTENWATILGLTYMLLNLLNGILILVPGDQEGWISKVRSVLDRISVLTNKDASGTVKLPLVSSKLPE